MEKLLQLVEEVRERHPDWTDENIEDVAKAFERGLWHGTKSEVLREGVCTMCDKQFGRHEYSPIYRKFNCPRR